MTLPPGTNARTCELIKSIALNIPVYSSSLSEISAVSPDGAIKRNLFSHTSIAALYLHSHRYCFLSVVKQGCHISVYYHIRLTCRELWPQVFNSRCVGAKNSFHMKPSINHCRDHVCNNVHRKFPRNQSMQPCRRQHDRVQSPQAIAGLIDPSQHATALSGKRGHTSTRTDVSHSSRIKILA